MCRETYNCIPLAAAGREFCPAKAQFTGESIHLATVITGLTTTSTAFLTKRVTDRTNLRKPPLLTRSDLAKSYAWSAT